MCGEIVDIASLTAESILSDDVFCELMDEKDPVYRERMIQQLTDRAEILRVKTKFTKLLGAYKSVEKQELEISRRNRNSMENWTDFGGLKYPDVQCGNWIANKNGVRTYDMLGEKLACYHPILPIQLLTNIETGAQKVMLAFCKNGRWSEITVPKSVISNNTKIVALSDLGVSVTSETAKYLVRYLADVENANLDVLPESRSTAKMGWIEDKFMPYDADVSFDGEGRFDDTYRAITKYGDADTWLDYVRGIRRQGRIEPRMMMAASFASVLLKFCDALPFWFNLWGETEGGKTVSLMLAASIWADPAGYRYITDFKSTDVSLELRADFLNHLPLMLDDTAMVKEKYNDDFSKLIYSLASGKGKSRSNTNLGIRREQSWQNTILCTGEWPLSNENLQGGAINRVLDFEVGETAIFRDGAEVVSVISRNYGFAGEMFVDAVEELGTAKIKAMQQEILERIRQAEKMEKQSISLSVLLTADKIATDYIFRDGVYIDLEDAKQVLVDRQMLSENERCYEYIMGEIAINANKFGVNSFGDWPSEIWGVMDGEYAVILNNVLERICRSGGYSYKGFLNWAAKKGILQPASNGKNTRTKRINGTPSRCVYLKQKQMDEDLPELDKSIPFE